MFVLQRQSKYIFFFTFCPDIIFKQIIWSPIMSKERVPLSPLAPSSSTESKIKLTGKPYRASHSDKFSITVQIWGMFHLAASLDFITCERCRTRFFIPRCLSQAFYTLLRSSNVGRANTGVQALPCRSNLQLMEKAPDRLNDSLSRHKLLVSGVLGNDMRTTLMQSNMGI